MKTRSYGWRRYFRRIFRRVPHLEARDYTTRVRTLTRLHRSNSLREEQGE